VALKEWVMCESARDKLERCKREAECINGVKGHAIRALLQAIEAEIEAEEVGLGELTDEQELLLQELQVLLVSLRSSGVPTRAWVQ
jgi:hypothetical protein